MRAFYTDDGSGGFTAETPAAVIDRCALGIPYDDGDQLFPLIGQNRQRQFQFTAAGIEPVYRVSFQSDLIVPVGDLVFHLSGKRIPGIGLPDEISGPCMGTELEIPESDPGFPRGGVKQGFADHAVIKFVRCRLIKDQVRFRVIAGNHAGESGIGVISEPDDSSFPERSRNDVRMLSGFGVDFIPSAESTDSADAEKIQRHAGSQRRFFQHGDLSGLDDPKFPFEFQKIQRFMQRGEDQSGPVFHLVQNGLPDRLGKSVPGESGNQNHIIFFRHDPVESGNDVIMIHFAGELIQQIRGRSKLAVAFQKPGGGHVHLHAVSQIAEL